MSGVIPFNCPTNTALLSFGEALGRSPGLKSYQHSRDLGAWHRDSPAAQVRAQSGALTPSTLALDTFAVLCSAVQLWRGSCCGAQHGVSLWSLSQGRMLSAAAGELSGDVTGETHGATWAALHLSYGARLSTSVPARKVLTHTSVPAIPNKSPAFLPVQNAPTIIHTFHHTSVSCGAVEIAVFRNHRHSTHSMTLHKHSLLIVLSGPGRRGRPWIALEKTQLFTWIPTSS